MSTSSPDDGQRLSHPIGETVLDRYRLDGVLGYGGFSTVYVATDLREAKQVGIKIIDPSRTDPTELRARFARELASVSELRSPNTIAVLGGGELPDGCPYLVMEYLEGRTTRQALGDDGPMTPAQVASIARGVLNSLAEAHDKGIVHRDLKPSNIFLERTGTSEQVKVLDFGIARSLAAGDDSRITRTGQLVCSPHYVAPERVVADQNVPAGDLYSLGVVMIELLEGRPPYSAPTSVGITSLHADLKLPVPLAPETRDGPLGPVITRATAKWTDQRYDRAEHMREDIDRVLRGQALTPAPQPRPMTVPGGAPVALGSTATLSTDLPSTDAPPADGFGAMRVLMGIVVLVLAAAAAFFATRLLTS